MDDTPKQSRALPIGVAAGLAVAVFGVLFAIRGSGSGAATAAATTEKPAEQQPATEQPAPTAPSEPAAATPPPAEPTPAPAPTATAPAPEATPDAAPAAVAATPPPEPTPTPTATKPAEPATPPEPLKAVVLSFVVTPADAKPTISIDGKEISSTRFAVKPGDSVKVTASAAGYTAFEKTVTAGQDKPQQEVAIALKKEGSSTPKKPTATRPKRPKVDL
jgi:hypothetical protein